MLGGCPLIFKSFSSLVPCIMVKSALDLTHKSGGIAFELSDSQISLAPLLAKLRIMMTTLNYYIIPHSVIKSSGAPLKDIPASILITQGQERVIFEFFFSNVVAGGGVDIGVAGELGDRFDAGAVLQQIRNHRPARRVEAPARIEL